jgi:DNA-binding NarL/FixJ family response regulator
VELLGRDAELAVLARAVADARGGRTRVLGVIGEAGIGKTELLARLAGSARDAGLLVLEGRCAEHERDVPFGVVVDALDEHVATLAPRRVESVGPELAAVLPAAERPGAAVMPATGAGERFRYHRALRGLLELLARERPVALLLDDLHWADEASLEFVLHLLRRPPRAACLLVFALRPGERGARVLAAARATLGFEDVPLGPLSAEAARSLLADVPDAALRERVLGDAAGNPLFLRELGRLARCGESALPATLTAAIGVDVAGLEPAARALLEGAAVAGDPFDPELAAAVAGLQPDASALDRLVAAELVRATGDERSFAFRHPLVRRVVYDGTPPAWRLDAHERAAAALERRGAGPAARAYHVARFARAGDRAAIALLTAAAAAATETSPTTAAHWYAAALRLLPDGDRARRGDLLAPMARALANAGRLQESRAAYVEALELSDGEPTPRRLGLVSACAQVETQLGRQMQARGRLLGALRVAPAAAQAGIAFELAADAMTHGRRDELRRWANHAVRMAGDSEPVLLAGAQTLATLGAIWTDAGATATAVDRAVARLHALDDRALSARVDVLAQVGRAQLRLGRYREASATLTRGLAVCRHAPHEQLLVWLRVVRAWTLALLLDLDAALLEVQAAEESARLQRAPHPLLLVLCKRILVHHHRGEAPESEQAAIELSELTNALEPSAFTAHAACQVAELYLDHDPERCIRELQAGAGPGLDITDPSMSSWMRLLLVRAALAAGRLPDADRWAAQAAARAAKLQLPVISLRASCARAEVLLAGDDATAAAALAQAAAAAAERVPAPLDATDARLLAGRALAAAGESLQAKAALQQVAAEAGRGGALRLRDTAARELRRLGTRVSAESLRTAHGPRPTQLSAREHHIAQLVADGHSNKQIAATLYLSEKTVRNALTRVYAKLGVRSRTQLTRTLTLR